MLIVKDKEGYIYGGYASQPWVRHGDFYGDLKSFLFQLYPEASIFKPTGANSNIQWVRLSLFSSTSKLWCYFTKISVSYPLYELSIEFALHGLHKCMHLSGICSYILED